MSLRLQPIQPKDQATMLCDRCLQLLLCWLTHRSQQGQELTVQFSHIALIYHDPACIQLPMDFHKLLMIVLMPPADVGQDIQSVGALW
jgi:hypothetical protein